jgi:ABC-type glycerol-3-phosphate transport system permease component
MNYSPKMMTGHSTIGPQFAAMAFAAIPLIVVYFIFQRQITKGMTMGAFR